MFFFFNSACARFRALWLGVQLNGSEVQFYPEPYPRSPVTLGRI